MEAPRCIGCGYNLVGLEAARCPECGRVFDFNNPATYTTKPLFNRFRYWLPGFLLAFITGAMLFPLLIMGAGFGYSVTLVLPLCLGMLIGYGCRAMWFNLVILGLILLGGLGYMLYSGQFVGIFCGIILAAVALGPVLVGTFLGFILRLSIKISSYDQGSYLPVLLILIAPLIAGAIEARLTSPYPDETVTTSITLPASVDRAWDSLMFYEEVHGKPPLLMRIALPHPLYTRGSTQHVGDTKVCVYSKGRLVKRVTRRHPNDELAFSVIEQTNIENHSVLLKTGSFRFTAISAGQTRVTLSTTYQPLLGPRWAWGWSERLGIHTLHGFVLDGMRLKLLAEESSRPALIAGDSR